MPHPGQVTGYVTTTIISTQRAGNVPAMEQLCAGLNPVWVVADEADEAEYRYAGARQVLVGGALCASRNVALDYGMDQGTHVLQLSDDLKKVEVTSGPKRADVTAIRLPTAVGVMLGALVNHPAAQLVGVAPTANPYFSKQRIHPTAFIVGDMILTRAGCPVRFDLNLRLKEDYDYTCQHLQTYGEVARIDNLLATFAHRTNRGGAVAVRTPELEQEMIDYLTQKWPGAIKPNPRRPGEVLLRWKP
jgi:hypothetical protein